MASGPPRWRIIVARPQDATGPTGRPIASAVGPTSGPAPASRRAARQDAAWLGSALRGNQLEAPAGGGWEERGRAAST